MRDISDSEQILRTEENKTLTDISISKEMVEKDIDKLKKLESPGPDEIYPSVLRECKETVSEPVGAV